MWSVMEVTVNRAIRRSGWLDVHLRVGSYDVAVPAVLDEWHAQGSEEFLGRSAAWDPSWDAAVAVYEYVEQVLDDLCWRSWLRVLAAAGVEVLADDHDAACWVRELDEHPVPRPTPLSLLTPITTDGPPVPPAPVSVRRGEQAA